MEGWITIGTKLDTSKFDKQIKELENKIKKEEEKSNISLKTKIKAEKDLQEHKQQIFELEKEYDKLSQKVEHVQGIMQKQGKGIALTPQDFTDLQNYNELNTQYEKMGNQLDKMYKKEEQLNMTIEKKKFAYQNVVDKVEEYKRKIEDVNLQKQNFIENQELKAQAENIAKIKDNFNGVGSSIQNAIHKVSRLALAVFSIRTAFTALSRASSELASYNPQYSANLEYIRYALTQMIAPVLEYIVNLAKTILAYINYIANAWFGVNLFANASAKSFNQVKKNIGGASTSAKELQKTLAGFDEMNILNSNSTGGGGGVAGAIEPDFDLSDLNAVEIPEWIKWIGNNKDIIVGAIKAIAEAFLIFKVLKIAKILSGVSGSVLETIKGLTTFKKFLVGAGIAAIIIGIVTAVESLINFLKNPSWDTFRGVLIGITTALAGLSVALLAINSSNPFGWVALAVAGVTGLITVIGDLVTNHDGEQRAIEAVRKAEEELTDARNKLKDATNNYIDAVDKAEDAEKKLKEAQAETGISIDDLLEKMDKENLTYKDLNENQRKVYKAYVNNTNAQENLVNKTNELSNAQDVQKEKLWQMVASFQATSNSTDEYKQKVVQAYQDGKISAEEASTAIAVALSNMDEQTRQSFLNNIPDAIKEGLNPSQYSSIANSFTNWWDRFLEQIKRKSDGIFGGIAGSMYNTLSLARNMNFGSYGASTGGYVTKMASGGIINMPNRGVPLASVIGGEAGREGIIPLTDQQAMAQLGAEIGRNVLVNLTNITSMNGRVISRELKNIRSEQDFAYNM